MAGPTPGNGLSGTPQKPITVSLSLTHIHTHKFTEIGQPVSSFLPSSAGGLEGVSQGKTAGRESAPQGHFAAPPTPQASPGTSQAAEMYPPGTLSWKSGQLTLAPLQSPIASWSCLRHNFSDVQRSTGKGLHPYKVASAHLKLELKGTHSKWNAQCR